MRKLNVKIIVGLFAMGCIILCGIVLQFNYRLAISFAILSILFSFILYKLTK